MMDVEIVRISEIPRLTVGGAVDKRLLVTYMVGPHGPFTEEFDRDGFTVAGARLKLEQFASELRALSNAPR